MSTPTTPVTPANGLAAARKGKKYGHVSLAYALAAVNPKSTLTGSDIATLEATGTAKEVAPVLTALKALPVKPGRFWDILEGRIAAPTKEVSVFAPKGKVQAAPAVAAKSDLI